MSADGRAPEEQRVTARTPGTGAGPGVTGSRAPGGAGESREPGVSAAGADGRQELGAASAGASGSQGRAAESARSREPGSGAVEGREAAAGSGGAEAHEPGAGSGGVEAQESGAGGSAGRQGGGGGGESDQARDAEAEAEIVVRDAISAPDVDGVPRRATRRFPLFTRDTARPEGGGRAAPRDAPAPARQWPVLAVSAAVGLGLLLTALDRFRVGTLLIGLALLAGAVLRWLLPDVGMLAVRSRFTDIATYGVLGTAIVLLAMMVQPDPWLVIPFLKDTLHFTVTNS